MVGFELMLAPMEHRTDAAFRQVCVEKGAGSTFTEMARISALARGNKSSLDKIKIYNGVPTYIQLIGSNEKELDTFLEHFEQEEGFLGFNLNLGCPSPNMIKKGFGCALIKRVNKVKTLVQTIRNHDYPVSIKLRVGMNSSEKEKKVYLKLIREVDADFFIVHARHGKEPYSKPADFDVYEECVKTGKVIVANGDIKNNTQIDFLRSIGVKGAMIGHAALRNPSIFNKLK